jgi:branched-subunit amino acid ABC-type transport system permease component
MSLFFSLVLSGAATGAIYSVMASGMVLAYRTTGIFNLSHGAVAFVVAYLYFQMHADGVPFIPALIIAVLIFAPLLGFVLDRLVMRRLAQAPVYARLVGTIGLLEGLPALAEWLVNSVGIGLFHLHLQSDTQIQQGTATPGVGPSPPHFFRLLFGVELNSDNVALFVLAAVAAVALWYLLLHTRTGLEMRLVVDRDTLASLRGVNAARTSSVAWVLTFLLAGMGGVLMAPIVNLQLGGINYTTIVLASLGAAVLGGFRSLPITFAGGLLIGVVEDLVVGYSKDFPSWIQNLEGLSAAVPYVLMLVLGLFIGRDRSRRAGSVAEDRPPVDHRRTMSAFRRRWPWVAFVVALLVFSMHWLPVLQADSFAQNVIASGLAYSIIFLSFVVVTGMGGMVSFAQASFVTAAGFGAGWALTRNWGINVPLIASHGHLNFLWAVVIGVVVAALLGVVIALPATRLGAVYLAIWSLAAAFFLNLVPFDIQAIGQGQSGWTIRSPILNLPGLSWVHHLLAGRSGAGERGSFNFANVPDQILLFLALFGLVTLVIYALTHSASGRAMLAVRSSQISAQASGIRAERTKIAIFALSAGIAGLGGVMLCLYSTAASNSTAPPEAGLYWLVLVVVLGIRRPGGALLAGLALAGGQPVFGWIFEEISSNGTFTSLVNPSSNQYFIMMLAGLSAIALAQEPDGLLALTAHNNAVLYRKVASVWNRLPSSGHKRVDTRQFDDSLAEDRQARIAAAEAAVHGGVIPDHEQVHGVPAPSRAEVPDDAALVLNRIVAGYGEVEVLHDVTIALEPGRIVALLGANGAGKSTLCSVAAGLLAPTRGVVTLKGIDITGEPAYWRARSGLLVVPEARGVFPGLTVDENLSVLLRTPELREMAYERFPLLAARRGLPAGVLSAGEQQNITLG